MQTLSAQLLGTLKSQTPADQFPIVDIWQKPSAKYIPMWASKKRRNPLVAEILPRYMRLSEAELNRH